MFFLYLFILEQARLVKIHPILCVWCHFSPAEITKAAVLNIYMKCLLKVCISVASDMTAVQEWNCNFSELWIQLNGFNVYENNWEYIIGRFAASLKTQCPCDWQCLKMLPLCFSREKLSSKISDNTVTCHHKPSLWAALKNWQQLLWD